MKRTEGVEMARIRKAGIHLPFRLLCLSVLPTGLGILKFYLHYYSAYRSGLLDYLVAIGLISGGIFLLFQKRSKVVVLTSGSFIVVEIFKAIVDYRDVFDVSLVIIAIIYLAIPFLRYTRTASKPEQKENSHLAHGARG